jgi:cell division protein FtsW
MIGGVLGARRIHAEARPPSVAGTWTARAHGPDWLLLAVVVTLVLFGLIAVYSSSYAYAEFEFEDPNYFAKRQAVWAGFGFLALLVLMLSDYRWLRWFAPPIVLVSILLLAAVVGFGDHVNGARRWISIGPLSAQPSEFAKFAVLIYLSAWLAAKGEIVRNFQLGVLPFMFITAVTGALVIVQPDLGTTIMIIAISGTLFFVANSKLTHFLGLTFGSLALGGLLILVSGYRMDRSASFTSAEADPSGLGFQTLQLLVAFGSGGVWGLGLGVSRQKFLYIPGSHTDGVMAIVGEELGFVGVVAILALFGVLLWRAALIAHRAPDTFGSLLATGVIAWIGFQLIINVAGVTRMIPLTGIPLPFLSSGGSALFSTMAAIGVLLSVSRYSAIEEETAPQGVVRSGLGDAPLRNSRGRS